ncbi:lipoate-protein ligase-like protein B [Phyllosticta citricarpa]|uniref:Octanoyltransferase n=2 Tax=Phyllosticta TaxID=121621 RepID=A0ABR1MNQ6_9PEZI
MRVGHLRLVKPHRLWPYQAVSEIQDKAVSRYLAAKADPSLTAPNPTIISWESRPVYTCGRREIGTVSPETQASLRMNGQAEFHEALRGGQTTFHGPGQLVAYPIIDLRRHKISPRDYVCLLEKSVIDTCAEYGVAAMTTENTGVWTSPKHKICAVGLHMRRNITSHGIGLNVTTNLEWFRRIVACGLPDTCATSLRKETTVPVSVNDVAHVFVDKFSKRLGIDDVDQMDNEDEYMKYLGPSAEK